MDNDSSSKIIGIDTIKVRIFDGVVRTLSNVKYVPKLRKSLISLRVLDNLGYVFSIKNGIMKINKGVFIAMKEKKVKKLYTLIKKTILSGTTKVEPNHEKSFMSIKGVVKVEEYNEMIKTPFPAKTTHWHKDESNYKKNEVIKKTKMIS